MKQQENDLERFGAIVREYARQEGPSRDRAYRNACRMLQEEIGEERFETAREAYDEMQFREAEAREDAWIESHYR